MIVETSRFGQLEVDGRRLITFPDGILGFPGRREYALVQTGRDSCFYWLQSVEAADLAFVVCDPRLFAGDYRVPVKLDELAGIELQDAGDAQVFVVVNKAGDWFTGNFQGPIVVNVRNRKGRQVVLSDRRYSTRHPLMRAARPQRAVKIA